MTTAIICDDTLCRNSQSTALRGTKPKRHAGRAGVVLGALQ
jgi:hypothetical protein